jgi:hypothetical protein
MRGLRSPGSGLPPRLLFPNQWVLQGVTVARGLKAMIPHMCIFEVYAIERFPEGEEPKTALVYAEPTGKKWGTVLAQDFFEHVRGAEMHDVAWLPRAFAESTSRETSYELPPQYGELHGRRGAVAAERKTLGVISSWQ